jgi:hypothetical protein
MRLFRVTRLVTRFQNWSIGPAPMESDNPPMVTDAVGGDAFSGSDRAILQGGG